MRNSNANPRNNLKIVLFILFVCLFFGTFGFMVFSDKGAYESIYLTIIILLSHFYHEVPEPTGAQILVVLLMIGSLIMIALLIKWLTEYIVEGQLRGSLKRKKMKKKIDSLKNHYIVCGYGRVGKQVADELKFENLPFVVCDRDPLRIKQIDKKGYLWIEGDPTIEETLIQAGIEKSKSLISALGEDADNLLVVIEARSLNPDLYIVARGERKESENKLLKAGANRIAMPYQIGGYHMATMAIRPSVVDFLDVIVDGKHSELQVEEIEVDKNSSLIGQNLATTLSRKKTGTTVLAINKNDGSSKINPSGDEILSSGDKLIMMGTKGQLEGISELIKK